MQDLHLKFSGLVSLVRLPNVIVLLVAQLLVAWRVFVPDVHLHALLFEHKFIFMLLATGSAISGGYIINHFYNRKRDLINRPVQTRLEQQISTDRQLYLYFMFNFLTLGLSFLISWRAALFFSVYIFLIWIYFHKIQPYPLWNELFVTFLIVYPFFGVMLFFKKWNAFIIWAGLLFVLVLLQKELIKNHLTLRGDMVQNIRTLLIVQGEKNQKRLFVFILGLIYLVLVRLYFLHTANHFNTFLMLLSVMLLLDWRLYVKGNYFAAYQLNKLIIISGVLALFLL